MQQYLVEMIQQERVRSLGYINHLLIKGWATVGDLPAAREDLESILDPAAGAVLTGFKRRYMPLAYIIVDLRLHRTYRLISLMWYRTRQTRQTLRT
jgi:hypothetical protein